MTLKDRIAEIIKAGGYTLNESEMVSEIMHAVLEEVPSAIECICDKELKDMWGCECGSDAMKTYRQELMRRLK